MRQCIKVGLFFFPLSLALVVFFQNCSDQGVDSLKLSSMAFKAAPFAYDSNIDTLAYMSCSEMGTSYDARAFFSFKAGSYTAASGININSTFFNYMKYYTAAERLTALQTSDANRGAWLQMSLRERSDYQNILASNENSVEADKDYYSFLQNLDSTPVSSVLLGLPTGARERRFSGITDSQSQRLEGAIRYLGAEGIADSVRTQLTGQQALLALTYTSIADMDDTAARAVPGSGNKVYGMGYKISFTDDLIAGANRVLGTVNETDLATGATSGSAIRSWTCRQDLRFKIVRPQDAATAPCTMNYTDVSSSATEAQLLVHIRKVLPVDYWSVDFANRCIMQKPLVAGFSCYGTRPTNAPAINYTNSTTCTNATNCPHYFSLCYRL